MTETALHVFRCNHLSNADNKQKMIEKFEKALKDAFTELEVRKVSVESVDKWTQGLEVTECDSNGREVNEAFWEQQHFVASSSSQ